MALDTRLWLTRRYSLMALSSSGEGWANSHRRNHTYIKLPAQTLILDLRALYHRRYHTCSLVGKGMSVFNRLVSKNGKQVSKRRVYSFSKTRELQPLSGVVIITAKVDTVVQRQQTTHQAFEVLLYANNTVTKAAEPFLMPPPPSDSCQCAYAPSRLQCPCTVLLTTTTRIC